MPMIKFKLGEFSSEEVSSVVRDFKDRHFVTSCAPYRYILLCPYLGVVLVGNSKSLLNM